MKQNCINMCVFFWVVFYSCTLYFTWNEIALHDFTLTHLNLYSYMKCTYI